MKNEWINTINKWSKYFNEEYQLKWSYTINDKILSIMDDKNGVSADIIIDNIVDVINESCELIFQLKDGQSISLLGYDPKINFYET